MYKLTAADFADTGQWKLLLKIGSDGLEAYLENTLHPEIEPQELCRVSWSNGKERICAELEEAVYHNPRLLDDFATRIVLYDAKTLFIPNEIAESSAGAEAELYNRIYKAEEKDIMTDKEGDITAVWSMAPGVKSFLMRTFPGARITCNLLQNVRKAFGKVEAQKSEVEMGGNETGRIRLFKEVRDGEVDFILINGKELLSASTHDWRETPDIKRKQENLLKAYEITDVEMEELTSDQYSVIKD